MKTSAKFFLLISLLVTISLSSWAQDDNKAHGHGHGWSFNDSTMDMDFPFMPGHPNMNDFMGCKKKHRFNGHWAGVELGVSGYLTPDFDMNFNPAYPYLNMNTARSLTVNLNPFDLNVNLAGNKLGFTTGLGFQISNYYFTGNYVMLKDSAAIVAYRVQDTLGNAVDLRVNKMVTSYLNLPLFFEYQTNPCMRLNSFHVTVGVIAGVRIGSYTKQVYNDKEGSYYLVDENGRRVASYDVDHYVARTRGAYHLNPFKLDAAFRIGWSYLNLFATYSLTEMFQEGQGPVLHPFTVGITLLGW